ncbi:MAG: hypothetical protein EOO00_05575, partial [Chitinophagaceae bacterium]
MNIKDYISSGIVESYVLGLADAAERAEFESMCNAHQEVRAAREAFELELEKQVVAGATAPPRDVKTKIFAQLGIDSEKSQATNMQPVRDIPTEAPVVRSQGWARLLAAASVFLLVGSTILNFYLFRQYKDYSERYSSLLASQTELAN